MLIAIVAIFLFSGQSSLAFSPVSLSQVRHNAKVTNRRKRSNPTHVSSDTSTTLYLGDFFNFGKPSEKEAQDAIKSTMDPNDEEEEIYYDVDDPIEKIFGVFFGKKEKSPGGMPRFGQSRFPEQYPATVDSWADPIDGDEKEIAILRPFLKNTNLEKRGLRLTNREEALYFAPLARGYNVEGIIPKDGLDMEKHGDRLLPSYSLLVVNMPMRGHQESNCARLEDRVWHRWTCQSQALPFLPMLW